MSNALDILQGHINEVLNREEDLGIPGLRKAKQDWHPVTQLKKAIVEIRLQ